MKGLDSGKDKIQKICEALREETLEPAKQEAREIVENAHLQAAEIVNEAKNTAEQRLVETDREIAERKKLCQSSLQLACRQTVEELKQKIEEKLFNQSLAELVTKEMKNPQVIAHLIQALVRAVEEQGVEEDFAALIPKEVSPKAINALLSSQILHKLEHESVSIGDFGGGAQIRLKGRQMTVDISDAVVRELLAQYVRRDFRELIFNL